MRNRPNVLSIVLAGGEGKRLMPLTADRAKPAVPFGGTYRLIDFVLSNLANSGLTKMAVLTQYKSHSLDRHIAQTWRMSTLLGSFVASVPAQQRTGKQWYMGSADAIYQSLNLITDEDPDYIVVFGADNIYRMDVSAMLEAHIDSGLECTVAGIRVPRSEASAFGIIDADDTNKINQFLEKPADPPGLPDSPDESFASMGNYIFTRKAFVEMLKGDAEDPESMHDMGGNVVPFFVNKGQAQVYDFTKNDVPGSTDRDRDYWRDVGTIDSYYDAHMDLISIHPVFNMYNYDWPIYTSYGPFPPAKFVHGVQGRVGEALNSAISPGVVISGARVEGSIISPNVRVHSYATVDGSVVLDGVEIGRNSQVRRAIIDKNVRIPPNTRIGYDRGEDEGRGFSVTESGVTVIGKGYQFPH